ncbi:MAG: hypothetical protein KGL38_06085 [Gemmatimonadota bacterium]|nr:hypothetical protein [Gemmatimonadota bacterium]MDE3127555.1 hypothetical protein [Gemmatimonadota bacterium]MDE3173973.1 hypothetical protein [Gemmatimonadota bacterium]MDE3215301.1 hypothetical protein [Gemmatimonadota bacterium]
MKKLALLLLVPALFACDTKAKQQLSELAKADSLRQDSLLNVKNQLLNDMLVSTQFINDIDAEIAKARSMPKAKAREALATPAEAAKIKEDRQDVLTKIHELVARLNSTDARLRQVRAQAASLSQHDSSLMQQIAQYEQTIAEFKQTVERQRTEFQAIVDSQNVMIAGLKGKVDTLTTTVSSLTTEQHTAYYVSGTRDDLLKMGVVVEDGRKPFLLFGDRPVKLAPSLDTTAFTRIDLTRDTSLALPAGRYLIFSRQDPAFMQPYQSEDNKIVGGMHITAPERFWATSKFLVLMKH